MKVKTSLLLSIFGLATRARTDPTWPADIDELEEIMYQTTSFNSRKFADTVNPCTTQISGKGRRNAAEWLRTAFHDMSTANIYQGYGGLDASIQYELGPTSENTGPGFGTTLSFMAPFMTRKSSMSDLIALGVYTSVLSCGGPSIDIRSGRVDATTAGRTGVPQPQNSISTFVNQFARLGFEASEMIQVTACGHSIGGVHSAENPDIVPVGKFPNEVATLDSTDAAFDNKIVTEYLDNSTKNPLVRKYGTATIRNSDFKVFSSDGNTTMRAMADASIFNSTCKTVFEKMINVVPPGVTLGDPIKPYQVKPVQLQLTLQSSAIMQLTGYIRVRTTNFPYANITGLTINYKNRSGGTTCGTGNCVFKISLQGISTGLEDSFAWYPIAQNIPVATGISSFTITMTKNDGTSTLFDNNGNGYPVQDGVILQLPQSCLNQGNGSATFIAAVRNDRASLPVNIEISYKTKRSNSLVPLLSKMSLNMTKGLCQGSYTFFSLNTVIPGSDSVESTVDVISGSGASVMVDSFKKANLLGGGCQSWSGGGSCSSVTVSSAVPSPTVTISHRSIMGGYKLVSCWAEASNGRALKGPSFAYDGMTLDSCMANCTGFNYWGTEYGRECYCGNSLDATSTSAPLTDCNMPCSGNATQYCGAGNRIELYSTTASLPAPTATLAHIPIIGKYSLVGCQTEANGVRALQAARSASDDMTLEKCAAFCSDFTYFGAEYGRECYCDNSLQDSSLPAPITDCNMNCAGNPYQYCGGGNRLELYKVASPQSTLATSTLGASTTSTPAVSTNLSGSSAVPTASFVLSSSSSTVSGTTASSSASSVPSLAQKPTVGPYNFTSCWTEGSDIRALDQKSYTSADNMTLENCASFCSGYKYFGTEYTRECYCGDFLASSSSEAPLSDCSMTCSGNQDEYCGGSDRLTLYQSDKQVVGPSQPATVGAYTYLGCRTEPADGGRALNQKATASNDKMTNEMCASFCDGFKYFGTEYGGECYCGDMLPASSLEAPSSDCNMVCSGSEAEYCGSGYRLSVYQS